MEYYMPSIIYNDRPRKRNGGFSTAELDPATFFKTHATNYYQLRALYNSTTDYNEKYQANAEMAIAERKMAYWRNHPDFTTTHEMDIISELKKRGVNTLTKPPENS